MQGIILKGIGGFYYALDENGGINTVRAQGKFRREHMKPKIGDRAEITPGNDDEHGWILKILPRTTELVRPPVANVDTIVVLVAAATPDPDLMLADRLILNARRAGIRVKLAVSKCDLDPEGAKAIVEAYRGAECEPVMLSNETGEGIEALRESLKGRIHAFAGQSGAGKSTTINHLYGLTLETGDLSRKIERGKNTTRHCELVPVEGGGMVLDTPGFSLLETELFDPVELQEYWPEFAKAEGGCFFQPCYHASEPRCAVRAAVAEGRIDPSRHERYTLLLDEMKQRWRERYD